MNRFVCLLLALSLVACEKATFVQYQVRNNAATPIIISGDDIIHAWPVSDTISPGTTSEIGSWSKRGITKDLMPATQQFGQSLQIRRINGDTATINWTDPQQWLQDLDDNRSVVTHTYLLIITEADF